LQKVHRYLIRNWVSSCLSFFLSSLHCPAECIYFHCS
jgi:hypothetical protein